VVRLDGLTRLQDQLGVHGISSLTTYFSAQLGAPARTHLVVGIGQGIYDLSLDGTAPIKLSTANICGGEISFTRDGRLAVCRSSDGIYAFPLTAAPAQPHMLLPNTYIEPEAPTTYFHVALSSDGMRLAVVARGPETSLAVYTLAPTTLAVQLVATFSLTQAVQARRIIDESTTQLVWSPDGNYLAFTTDTPTDTATYLLHVAPFMPATIDPMREPLAIPIATDALTQIPFDGSTRPLLWSADSADITYVDLPTGNIKRMTIATGQVATLLVLPEAHIVCYVARTPELHALIFDLCRRRSDAEIVIPSDQLFLYSGVE